MCKSVLNEQFPVIVVKVYHRKEHLKRCIESLERAVGANNYHLIIGSDAPITNDHAEDIERVRDYLKNKERNHKFSKFSVIYHKNNVGEIENGNLCHQLAQVGGHDRFIMMEDDVIVGSYFLEFMKDSLKLFEADKKVIAINGYLDDKAKYIDNKPFLYNRFCAYGYASWYAKWVEMRPRIDTVNYAKYALGNLKHFKKIMNYAVNAKSYPFLAMRFYRAVDLEIGLMMEVEDYWVMVPHVSLTANKGLDGSGLRSGFNPRLQAIEPYEGRIEIPKLSEIKKISLIEIKDKISFNNIVINWFSIIVYRYLPFGFSLLKYIRRVKRSF